MYDENYTVKASIALAMIYTTLMMVTLMRLIFIHSNWVGELLMGFCDAAFLPFRVSFFHHIS